MGSTYQSMGEAKGKQHAKPSGHLLRHARYAFMKAAIYCRLSEEDKNKQTPAADSESIQNQKSMLQNFALEQGWEVYRIYSDDDYTGSDRKRPEFNRLLEDAKMRKFEIVLCKTQSRFTRELELVEKYIHGLFPIWGIRFISIVDNADTANRGNKKSRQINGLVNEWYLEDMSESIKSVLNDKRKKGIHIGAFALYGYKKDPDQKGHLIIDEEAAAVVREVFTLFSQGYGKTAIARLLNDRNIPNPTEYKRIHGLRYQQPKMKNSALWKYSAIANMLNNEIYIGNMVQGKYGSISYKTRQNKPRPQSEWYRVEGTHEPIIERELWNSVQTLLAQRTKPFSTGEIGLFAGKAKCANCGYTMRSSKSRNKHYLQCSNRHVSKDACIGSFISVEKLEIAVTTELNRLSAKYLDKEALQKQIRFAGHSEKKIEHLKTEISLHQKRSAEYAKCLRELYVDKVRGVISENDYLSFSKDFSMEKDRLMRITANYQQQLNKLTESIPSNNNYGQKIEAYTSPRHLNREMVEKLIDSITIGKRISGTTEVPVEIHWNF